MFLSNNHALRTGVAIATVLGITLNSCTNDDAPIPQTQPRTKTYELKGTKDNANKKVGEITLAENRDSSVNVIVTIGKNTKDANYVLHFIGGTAQAPRKDTVTTKNIKGTEGNLIIEIFKNVTSVKTSENGVKKDVPFKYNDAVKFVSHIKVLNNADTLAFGNFGSQN